MRSERTSSERWRKNIDLHALVDFNVNTVSYRFVETILCVHSQGDRGTKIHVYLPYRGAILCCVYIVRLGLINIFLHVERNKISCVLQPTRFPLNFLQNYVTVKEGEIYDLFLGKINYVIKK